jgi:hypothetical protein
MDRPTFFNDSLQQIRACGIMCYRYDTKNKTLEFLLINDLTTGYIQDFGGKTDIGDLTSIDTALRETREESNKIINLTSDDLDKITMYNKWGKYLLYFCNLDKHPKYSVEVFGNKEEYEGIPRTIIWIPANKLILNWKYLHPRIKTHDFIECINNLIKKYTSGFNLSS